MKAARTLTAAAIAALTACSGNNNANNAAATNVTTEHGNEPECRCDHERHRRERDDDMNATDMNAMTTNTGVAERQRDRQRNHEPVERRDTRRTRSLPMAGPFFMSSLELCQSRGAICSPLICVERTLSRSCREMMPMTLRSLGSTTGTRPTPNSTIMSATSPPGVLGRQSPVERRKEHPPGGLLHGPRHAIRALPDGRQGPADAREKSTTGYDRWSAFSAKKRPASLSRMSPGRVSGLGVISWPACRNSSASTVYSREMWRPRRAISRSGSSASSRAR